MSITTNIEWATSTGNPWIGCTKVSPGCRNCYAAELDAKRFSKTMGGGTKANPISHWGKGAPRFRTKGFWKDAIRWNAETLCSCGQVKACDESTGKHLPNCGGWWNRPRIFPSLCDWLDDEVPIEWLADFLKLIHDTPNLDWLLLTKRPERFLDRLSDAMVYLDRNIPRATIQQAQEILAAGQMSRPDFERKIAPFKRSHAGLWCGDWLEKKPPANVWVGTSIEDQQRANERIPELLKIPAKIRFLSVEPLLGDIDFPTAAPCGYYCDHDDAGGGHRPGHGLSDIHWVIVGGESGPAARPCAIEWIQSVICQCQSASVPVFVKQLGGNLSDTDLSECARASGRSMHHKKGGDPTEWPQSLQIRQFP